MHSKKDRSLRSAVMISQFMSFAATTPGSKGTPKPCEIVLELNSLETEAQVPWGLFQSHLSMKKGNRLWNPQLSPKFKRLARRCYGNTQASLM